MENIKEATEQAEHLTNENVKLAQQEDKLQQQQASETPCKKQQHQEAEIIEDDDDDDYDDDDEEKDTSQKLIIDIPDEEDEDEDDEQGEEVVPIEEVKPQELPEVKELVKPTPKPIDVDAIITLSDGEEDVVLSEIAVKPGKVQKRRSVGAPSAAGNEEEHYRLKRRKINVAGAPKMPLTGYVRYMNDRRETLRKEHPTKTAMEHTKMIGEEWQALAADVKTPYLKAADVDKQRYVKELNSFLKLNPDVLASELAKKKVRKTAENNSPNPATTIKSVLKEKQQQHQTLHENPKTSKDLAKDKHVKDNAIPTPSTSQQATAADKTANERNKRPRTPTPPSTNTNANANAAPSNTTFVTPAPGEIPIFTNEFLEHNKLYDMELRTLRKSNTDLEQQNSVLEKHVENMKFGVEKMVTENNELQEKNRLLEIYLDKLKRKLAQALGTLPLPSAPNGATVDNIDRYMQDLYKMSTSNSHGPATLNKAKDIIRKLDLQIQL